MIDELEAVVENIFAEGEWLYYPLNAQGTAGRRAAIAVIREFVLANPSATVAEIDYEMNAFGSLDSTDFANGFNNGIEFVCHRLYVQAKA